MAERVAFLDMVINLPASAPKDHAHIIDQRFKGRSTARIQDAIVTVLFNVCPNELPTFLDPNVKDFRLVQTKRRKDRWSLWSAPSGQLVIWKRGRKVILGVEEDLSPVSLRKVVHNIVLHLEVNDDGAWNVPYASVNESSERTWKDIWETTPERESERSIFLPSGIIPKDEYGWSESFSASLTETILEQRMWSRGLFTTGLVIE
ncbi:uncharacterized protein yc1106_01069 [Curvularia clavata]|uniref:Uncharacterized protein n=1 Tax=Curvularia clavata TaxID=95742 RepID=A0A9Q9DP43_CURCL|nr:uncharacterized protein yc1106_01069 [Curvularia clavata]